MKTIILAAGMGTRLGKNIPKSLVELNGKTILQHQIENLATITDICEITVVIGYKGELIRDKYPGLSFIYNQNFFKTNTAKSLLLGIEKLNEDILFINGDVVFDPEILSLLKDEPLINLVFVNNSAVGDEEIKYSIDENGFINELSKNVHNSIGEAVGINFICSDSLEIFKSNLKRCKDNDYFERAIEFSIEEGISFKPLNIGDLFCLEIDFPEDLVSAKKYINGQHV